MNAYVFPVDDSFNLQNIRDDRSPHDLVVSASVSDSLNEDQIHKSDQVTSEEVSSLDSRMRVLQEDQDIGPNDVPLATIAPIETFKMPYVTRYITVIILTIVNLLNYMDRFTIAGVLEYVKEFYNIQNTEAGLLQAIFVIGYMCTSPFFGYFGDRYNRKYLMTGGILFWSLITLAGSFVPKDMFWLFVLLRGFVGVGEASYSTIAPTLISDMFVKEKRSLMLMVFYFAIPVGSGLGYIAGSSVAEALGFWAWALRVTPGLGVICCLLIMVVAQEPPRGMAEEGVALHSTSILLDLKELFTIRSFVLSTLGGTCVAFVSGALALFAPNFMYDAYVVGWNATQSSSDNVQQNMVSLYFGIVTCAAGFIGVTVGTMSAKFLKQKHANGDAIVCAFGLLTSAPFLFLALIVCQYSMIATWILILIGEILLFLIWPLVADILLYTVVPTRRSSAEALQIFTSHLLGDAGSPYLLGIISDYLNTSLKETDRNMLQFRSMQYSLLICCFIAVIGGGFFLWCSLHIVKDRAKADAITKGLVQQEWNQPGLDYSSDDEDRSSDDVALLI